MAGTRIAPLELPYPPALDALIHSLMPARSSGPPLILFRTLAQSPASAKALQPLLAHILSPDFSIPRRERELVIQRVCARCGCEYEWGVHAAAWGPRAGVAPELLAATLAGPSELVGLDEGDRLLFHLVDELHEHHEVSTRTWEGLAQRWRQDQMLDLMLLVGWYHALCLVINGLKLAPEDWALRFPVADPPEQG